MKIIRDLRNVMRFMQLPKEHRRLVFYSEGKNYWPHLKDLVEEAIASLGVPVCYISSDADDPGLAIEHPHYHSFEIDEGYVRNWLFENIETDIMAMTMPDLDSYQLKSSKHDVHYFYIQHCLLSLQMVYRTGAFNSFDTICCAGPHHIEEMRAIEEHAGLEPKNLVNYGYALLWSIIAEAKKRPKIEKPADAPLHVLLAPSWGPKATIESGVGVQIVDQLMEKGYQVTLRPHPQTIKLTKGKVDEIVKKHQKNPLFSYEASVDGQESLHSSDIMICDWSGVALDYAFGLNKPVLFVDVPRKVNNPGYKEIDLEPFEVTIREKIGKVVDVEDVAASLAKLDLSQLNMTAKPEEYFYPADAKMAIEAMKKIMSL